jgi:hypothetical protein
MRLAKHLHKVPVCRRYSQNLSLRLITHTCRSGLPQMAFMMGVGASLPYVYTRPQPLIPPFSPIITRLSLPPIPGIPCKKSSLPRSWLTSSSGRTRRTSPARDVHLKTARGLAHFSSSTKQKYGRNLSDLPTHPASYLARRKAGERMASISSHHPWRARKTATS